MSAMTRMRVYSILLGTCAIVFGFYYENVFILEKYSYNQLHPYTSWLPITVYIMVKI